MGVAQQIVKRPVLGIIVFALIAIIALFFAFNIPIDMFPEISPTYFVVVTSYRGAGPETVENSVTKVLENRLTNTNGLQKISSTSSEGLSRIVLEFGFNADIAEKTNDVRERLDRVRAILPDGADVPIIRQFDPSSQPILRIAVRGNRPKNELHRIATDMILDRLEQVDGVATTSVSGGVEQQVRVEISQNRLEAYGLTISGIAGILASQNLELGAGSIVDGSKNYSIRTSGEYRTINDIAGTVIARRNNVDIRLIDIGEVRLGYPKEISSAYINEESGIFISVTKQTGANSVAVADRVYAKLREIQALMPGDVSLEIIQDNTTQIRVMINELLNSALMGAALAMGILFLFLRNMRSTIIIGISIPFSVMVTLLLMNLMNYSLNMLTMAGLILGIGMIVDSSIVILENIFKYRERGTKHNVSAVLGSQEVISSIVSGNLTTLCVFVPVILFKNDLGLIGILIQDLFVIVGIALVSSLLVSIFLVPILASKYLPLYTRAQMPLRNKLLIMLDDTVEKGIVLLTKAYTRLLAQAVKHRFFTTLIVVALFFVSIISLSRLQIIMLPQLNEDSFTLNVTLAPGTIYDNTKATMLQIQDIAFAEIQGMKSIVTEINQSSGSISVSLNRDMPGADSSAQAKNRLRARFNDFLNAEFSFAQGIRGLLTGGSDIDIALRINDIESGLKAARKIEELLEERIPELIEVSVDMTEGLPQVEMIIDRNRAYNLGLSIGGIAREIAAAMNGVTATIFRQEGSEYSVVLELRKEDREKLPDLGRIFVASNTGNIIPLSNFATLEKSLGPSTIRRQNQSRIVHITGTLAKSSAPVVEKKIQEILAAEYILSEGISLSYEGQARQISKTSRVFIPIIVLAILLVFGVMAGVYESFKDPFINLFTIPLMLIGITAIYSITGQPISMLTLIGIVMLVGIVVNNGIILVDYTNLLVGRGVPVRQACIEAGESRLRPVLMTTLTTILGVIPLVFFPGEYGTFIQPLGLTVIGGLFSSTFVTLIFIPVLYSLINEHRGKKKAATEQVTAESQAREEPK